MEHDWIKSTLGHGETMCSRCKVTNREAGVLGILNQCDAPPTGEPAPEPEAEPDQYAILEVFGHRRHAGRIKEVDLFGAKLCRIDIPKDGDFAKGFTTMFYGGSSIFSMTPCDLKAVQHANRPYAPASLLSHDDEEDEIEHELDPDEQPF